MALLGINLGLGGSASSTGSGNLLNLDLGSLLDLHVGAGGTTSVITVDGSISGSTPTSAATSPVINLGVDLGTGLTGGNGGLLGGLLGGGSAGAGDGLIPATVDLLLGTVKDLTGVLLGTGTGTGTGGTNTNPGTPGLVINGTEGVDLLQGTAGNDTITAFGGNDLIYSNGGNDIINGGAGRDTLVFSGTIGQYTAASQNGVVGFHNNTSGVTSFTTGVERIEFQDHTLALDFNGNAGQVYRLYQAEFNRVPDTAGLTHNIQLIDNGIININQMADAFVGSPESQQTYGPSVSDGQFVTNLYANTLHRAPDQVGFTNWTNALANHVLDRGDVLLGFSESAENHNNTDHQLQNGILLDHGIA
ncbi:DUF4214 domain-containing protein [Methylobacterium sp. WL12]|uniref:DUF4214 domain-containing protein n=1 Tax=Methylobacterium sp. WL12 TaxID=2603890 RepID=UPI0011C7B03B|nr:DUF4214 domain-containing protein [Methylobacterium sp. WL12]TXM67326.1 DUF4214 domain-containing protein [Methylobacterium sp. WL12]